MQCSRHESLHDRGNESCHARGHDRALVLSGLLAEAGTAWFRLAVGVRETGGIRAGVDFGVRLDSELG